MANLRALVCDDEAPLRDLMARRLEKMGLEVERAESGKDAAARIDTQRYDLLITDIYMPDVTGLELLQQMKAMDPHAQVVVVTASATLDNAVGALNHGAFAYLTKPFDHLTVFDNVVARAVEFRKALLDNLRMGEVQRRRGDMLEEEITGRIRQVKRAQEYLVDLLTCLPVGVAVLDSNSRVDLINPRAEDVLGPVLSGSPDALLGLLEQIPLQDGVRRGEVEVGGRRLDLHLTELHPSEQETQQVLVVRESDVTGAAMGTLVQEALVNLRGGLGWLMRREKGQDALKILKGMTSELMALAALLDAELPEQELLPASEPPPAVPVRPAEPEAAPSAEGENLATAVIPPKAEAAPTPPGNGKEAVPERPPAPKPPGSQPLPQPSGSMMLRKGMTMVLEGRLRKKRGYAEPVTRPEDADRMQEKIARWAKADAEDKGPPEDDPKRPKTSNVWPPPLPSSSGKV